ncbi:MAG: peptidoglycan-binding protein [Lachnospiraceae bacterium]|nr:peptidoglycan-binding protein [Lachnospiraceae bacterium]
MVNGSMVATVRHNDRNEYVKLLQKELGIKADGIFGPATEDAVRIFQRTHGLKVDGIVGYNTWSALL